MNRINRFRSIQRDEIEATDKIEKMEVNPRDQVLNPVESKSRFPWEQRANPTEGERGDKTKDIRKVPHAEVVQRSVGIALARSLAQ